MKSSKGVEIVEKRILRIRDRKVILDRDLAELYGVETAQLKRQIKRNIERFPEDFMFVLTKEEFDNLRCQIGTSRWGGTRYPPMAFTEHGAIMAVMRGHFDVLARSAANTTSCAWRLRRPSWPPAR